MFEDSCSWLSSNPELTSSWCSVVSWCCVVIVWACSKEGSEAWQQSAAGTTGVTLSFCLANLAWLYMHACNCVIVYAYATQWPCMCALSLLHSPFNEKKSTKLKNVTKGLQWQLGAAWSSFLSLLHALCLFLFYALIWISLVLLHKIYTICPSIHLFSCPHILLSLSTLSLALTYLPLCLLSVFSVPLSLDCTSYKECKKT